MGWFYRQFTADAGSQMLLQLLCWRADEAGGMTPIDRAYLARHSRQSERSVSRALKEFEECGAFTRRIIFDEDGGRLIAGKLNFDVTMDMPTVAERNAMRPLHGENGEAEAESGRDNLSLPDDGGVGTNNAQVGTNSACAQDNLSRPSLCIEKPIVKSLKSAGEPARERDDDFQKRLEENHWPRFLKAYPFTGSMDMVAAKRGLGKLGIGDREEAIKWAAVYAADTKTDKRSFAKEAWRWLAERHFEQLAQWRKTQNEAVGVSRDPVFVIEGSPWWDTWQAWRRSRGMLPSCATSYNGPQPHLRGKRGWYFPSQFPAKADTTDPPAPPAHDDEISF